MPETPTELPLTFIEGAHDGRVTSVSFSPAGKSLLTAGNEDMSLRVWDLTTTPPHLARELPKAQDKLLWATLRPDGREVAAVGRGATKLLIYDLDHPDSTPRSLVGHEQTVFRAIYAPDGRQLASVGGDATVRLWDLEQTKELFKIRLPTEIYVNGGPSLWDFDLRCTEAGVCWIAVPLTMGRLALYRLPYEMPPE